MDATQRQVVDRNLYTFLVAGCREQCDRVVRDRLAVSAKHGTGDRERLGELNFCGILARGNPAAGTVSKPRKRPPKCVPVVTQPRDAEPPIGPRDRQTRTGGASTRGRKAL